MCAASLSVVVGDGASTGLWTDNWASVGPLNHFAPVLFTATSRTGKKRLLRDALHNQWASDITGAPTTQVLHEYLRVWELLHSFVVQPLASFVYAEKQAETLFRLNFCKRKTLFRLKNKLKSTDYKPAEQGQCWPAQRHG
jgi:hypothetical protein